MSECQEYDQNINDMLDTFEKEIKALDKKDAAQKKKAIQRNQTYLKQIDQMIQAYKLDVQALDKSESASYTESLKQINSRHMRLKNDFEYKKNEGTDKEQLFQGRNGINQDDPENMTGEELMTKARQIQDDGTEILTGLVQIIEQNNQLADQINSELDDQITKLDNIYKDVKDTQTELKRTQTYLRYFMRQIYTDKILMCLICLIFLAVVALIILSSLGVKFTSSSSSNSSGSSSSNQTPSTKRFLADIIGSAIGI